MLRRDRNCKRAEIHPYTVYTADRVGGRWEGLSIFFLPVVEWPNEDIKQTFQEIARKSSSIKF